MKPAVDIYFAINFGYSGASPAVINIEISLVGFVGGRQLVESGPADARLGDSRAGFNFSDKVFI